MNKETIIKATRAWVENPVISLNLCPFAKRELVRNRVRFAVTDASTETQLLLALDAELKRLDREPDVETTLLIHPEALGDFDDYNQLLDLADALLVQAGWEGVYQIASFHPDYQFAGTEPEDAENYTNRSPYPMLHLLREASLANAVDRHPDVGGIPERNIALLQGLGTEAMAARLQACLDSQ